MTKDGGIVLRPIGRVESPLVDRAGAPKQGWEGSPEAWLVFDEALLDGLRDLRVGTEVIVLTWLDRADRGVLAVHPRDDPAAPLRGVFSTRSADRPNPIGLHPVQITAIEGPRLRVRHLEALDGTPVLDVKPVLGRHEGADGDADPVDGWRGSTGESSP
jgi:tRNA-Thr(GGU) m(6)t(6)A37 methyltransferase TsaA